MTLYDSIGIGYTAVRAEDPRLRARIHAALGDARRVLNVGAGAGSYEPRDRDVVAVEPSQVMIAQRPPGAAPVIRATAEALPFDEGEFDAAIVVLSDHHCSDRAGGLRELRRVARRVVVFTWDRRTVDELWLIHDYLPGFAHLARGGMDIDEIARHVGGGRIEPVPIPHDCRDGFLGAYWRRPEAYLDPQVRAGISVFAQIDPGEIKQAVERLRVDLATGAWRQRHGHLLELDELDLGYRLVVSEA